jgi:hypothetical protein
MRTLTGAVHVLVVPVTLSLACEPSTMPIEQEPPTYVLQEVAGDPLPTLLVTNENFAFTVLSDTIRLYPDGTGTISGVTSAEPVQPLLLPVPPTWASAEIRYQVRRLGDQLEIEYPCPPDAMAGSMTPSHETMMMTSGSTNGTPSCAPPPHLLATRQGNLLVVAPAPGMLGRSPRIYTLAD